MCFYDQYIYSSCGDWKWANFRAHCPREHRTGETCGMKLVHSTSYTPGKCRFCDKIDIKLRKRAFEVERVDRWRKDQRNCRTASMQKSEEVIRELEAQIDELVGKRELERKDLAKERGKGRARKDSGYGSVAPGLERLVNV